MLVFKVAVQEKKNSQKIVRVASFPANLASSQDARRIGDKNEVAKLHAVDFATDAYLSDVYMRSLKLFDTGHVFASDGRSVVIWSEDIDPNSGYGH